jgi:CBS domain-containing protein
MNVENILKNKGSAVVTARESQTLQQIAKLIADHRIGAVVVVDAAGAPLGIVSERDIVNALAASGAAALETPAGRAMTRNLITCTRDKTADELLAIMTASRIRHLPVVEDGKLRGIVSIGDVVKLKLDEAATEVGQLREYVMAGR